jgi:hypothetical protein
MICDGAVGVPRGEPGDGPTGQQVRTSVRKRVTSSQLSTVSFVRCTTTGYGASQFAGNKKGASPCQRKREMGNPGCFHDS